MMEPVFTPALHRQRHQFVIDFVRANKPRKVVDLGCGECTLLQKLKFQQVTDLLVGVDIKGEKIKKNMYGLAPISTDYLQPSFNQLRIELYEGSVTQPDSRLRGFDLATAIELIEHLIPADVTRFSAVLFGYMAPTVVLISTPNSDFNPLFPGLRGFRNSDHKFEWSRAEFQSWALGVCSTYGYEVEFTGVGRAGPAQHERVGFCSQIGVFHRLGARNPVSALSDEHVLSYTLIHCINYPSLCDNNTLRKVLVGEVLYQVEQVKAQWAEENSRSMAIKEFEEEQKEEWHERGDFPSDNRYVSIPLSSLWSCSHKIRDLSSDVANLRHVLMDEPQVQLSERGDALLVKYKEEEDKESLDELEDSECTEISCRSQSTETEEDWETDN